MNLHNGYFSQRHMFGIIRNLGFPLLHRFEQSLDAHHEFVTNGNSQQ